ncbi:hypothetical protein KRR38_24850 [Novosphingobium sp. G106]|jgi:pyruvate/2-oxoglutarate dehydrogenase complex dihydrolipoamide acyltransferase (E2) component|uniref:hypothetical protein n=1 Tax=Novosphingobium sp. G106 TaxID=2849500 RepID=UPI001C2D6454|nr:hypothetical protein [Novosphingobium sp. G106]MBV1690817.1 hypothetical protein [Novosphingobium sp. G106]
MNIRKPILIAAGAALLLGSPAAVLAQADPAAPPTASTMPSSDPTMAAPAASAPAAAAANPAPVTDTSAAAKDYPRCSATVTDGCIQGGGSKTHRAKTTRHKKG